MKRRTHRWLYLGVSIMTTVATSVFMANTAGAVLAGTTFEGNDGNLVVDGAGHTDWANVTGLHVGIDNTSGTGDNSFGQGTKEDNPDVTVVSGSIPPNKSDLTRFYEAAQTISGQTFLYLAWERSNILGNANMDFEIDQSGTTTCPSTAGPCTIPRTNGDILITYDFGGSGSPVIGALRWLTVGGANPYDSSSTNTNTDCFSANTLPCWGDHKALSAADAEGAVNTVTVSDPIQTSGRNACPTGTVNGVTGPSCPADTFGEAAINLTGAGIFGSGSCGFGQATTFLKSRSSTSFTSEIKDFIAPEQTPLSACSTSLNTAPWIYPNDDATVSTNNSNINGSVTFSLYDTSAHCTTGGTTGRLYTQTVALPTTTATSKTVSTSNSSVAVTSSGTVYWNVSFTSSDTANPGRNSACTETIATTLTGESTGGTAP